MPEETANSKSDGILPEQVFDFVCSYAKLLHKKRELCNSNHLSSTTALFKSPLNKISFCEHDNLTHELCTRTAKKDVAVQWNLYLGDTLGTRASVP